MGERPFLQELTAVGKGSAPVRGAILTGGGGGVILTGGGDPDGGGGGDPDDREWGWRVLRS